MCRNGHDCSGSVTHQYIIRYPDRHFLTIYRVDCSKSIDCDTGLILGKLSTLKIRLSGSLLTVCKDLFPVLDLILVFIKIWMLRRDNHISNTE